MKQLRATGMTEPGVLVVNGVESEEMGRAYHEIDLPANWHFWFLKKNVGCNAPLNMVFEKYPNEPYYAAIDDDEWVETDEWDKKLVTTAGRWKIANANDGWQSERRIQSFVCIGGDLVRATGWHVLPRLFHWYGEQVWEDLDRVLDLRVWRGDIKAEHRHWANGKAEKDETYRSQDPHRAHDGWVYNDWRRVSLLPLAARIREVRSGNA